MEKGNKEEILDNLKSIINETFKINRDAVDFDTLLFNGGLNLSSIQLLELTVSIETFYDAEFDGDMLTEENFKDISALINVIAENFTK